MTARQLGGACAGRQPGALAGCGLRRLREVSSGALVARLRRRPTDTTSASLVQIGKGSGWAHLASGHLKPPGAHEVGILVCHGLT